MVKIGMMIGDRYEVLEKIGTGGMSDVYKAKCHKLNRFVAIKVLKQEFSENANFVSKFRTEAQAAAGLMHPNIVNVYDVGEENGIYYIVMELVEGITLKKYIEKKARLSFKEAVSIAIQVSMGIEAAHNNHIIHRDIKPQNIIISKDGKVKVTDFGIAKAATSNTITSNVMGSVHYTSPEQARGGYSDEKSDIYSLGITIFEMLTGRVPFNGETTVAIAIKHIQEELPSPKEFVPEIPASVEGIVMKCCQKSPDRRYQSMPEVIADLKQSLMNPEEAIVSNDPDMEAGTRPITDSERAQIKRRTTYHDRHEYEEREQPMRLRAEAEPVYEDEAEPEDEDDYDYNPRMENVTTFLALLAGVVICVIVVILAVKVFGDRDRVIDKESSSPLISAEEETPTPSPEIKYVKMPEVKGKGVEEARNELKDLGIESEVEYQESDDVEMGKVISADAEAGADVEVGSKVRLTASAGAQGALVPSVTGMSFDEAKNKLTAEGFTVTREEASSNDVEEGKVISQVPAAQTKVAKGTNITVIVSQGKEKVRVPNLLGLTEADARVEAQEAGLRIENVSYENSDEQGEGKIFYQSYSKGSYVDPDTAIDIKVSSGPKPNTYKCNASILAPSVEEAPDYAAGTEVAIKLVTDDGHTLLETRTASFPQAANYYGLTASAGTITMTYTVTIQGEPVTDPETGETTTPEPVIEERSFTRRIEFVEE